jgi:CrcB protein
VTAALFVVCAGAGAALRHLVNRLGTGWRGTLALNVVGAFALGAVLASDAANDTITVVGVGLLGSITTFSTFSLEVAEAPRRNRIVIVSATLVLGLGAAALGHTVG